MAKTWWQKEQERKAREGAAPVAEKTEASASDDEPTFSGVPSREEQQAESEKAASSTPKATTSEAAHAMSGSGNVEARTAPSAPGGTVTTKDGTFTAEEWAAKQKALKAK